MVSGVLAALGAFFPGNIAYWLVLGPVLASSLFLVVYSYVLWREEQTGSPRLTSIGRFRDARSDPDRPVLQLRVALTTQRF